MFERRQGLDQTDMEDPRRQKEALADEIVTRVRLGRRRRAVKTRGVVIRVRVRVRVRLLCYVYPT